MTRATLHCCSQARTPSSCVSVLTLSALARAGWLEPTSRGTCLVRFLACLRFHPRVVTVQRAAALPEALLLVPDAGPHAVLQSLDLEETEDVVGYAFLQAAAAAPCRDTIKHASLTPTDGCGFWNWSYGPMAACIAQRTIAPLGMRPLSAAMSSRRFTNFTASLPMYPYVSTANGTNLDAA